ncbi:high mobility group protein 2 [Cochliomyia hominivorax]
MESIKETNEEQEVDVNTVEEEITKPDLSQQQQQQENQILQQNQDQEQQASQEQQPENVVEEEEEEEVTDKQIETPSETPIKQQQQETTLQQQPEETPAIDYAEEVEEDEDDDDDEEKETSQKLVIDIPEDEEEEEEEEEDDEVDEGEVIALDDLPQAETATVENDKILQKPQENEAIITLSDGEEDVPITDVVAKPGKIQKRRSMGAGSVTANNEEERFRLKRRKINVAGAPKMPLTGYVRYMNDRRESLRKEHPNKTSNEHTKMIGEEWHSLPADVKSSYLKAADVDKQRYVKELHSFLKSRPDVLASELAKNKIRKTADNNNSNTAAPASVTTSTTTATANSSAATKSLTKDKSSTSDSSAKSAKEHIKDKISKEIMPQPSTSQQAAEKAHNEKNKRKRTPTPPSAAAAATAAANTNNANPTTSSGSNINASTSASSTGISIVTPTPGEIPIFTNEFLEHNKIYDMELRSLRKSKTDLEQQNSVLEKHVENMKFGVEKMITENNELEEKNRLLEIYLDKLKRKLALALSSLPLPSAPNGATVDNIDKYMQDLYNMSTSNSHGPATLNKAKDIIRKLDLQIQL